MEVFKKVVEEQLNKTVFMPANKDTAKIPCTIRHEIKIVGENCNPGAEGYLLRHSSIGPPNNFRLVE